MKSRRAGPKSANWRASRWNPKRRTPDALPFHPRPQQRHPDHGSGCWQRCCPPSRPTSGCSGRASSSRCRIATVTALAAEAAMLKAARLSAQAFPHGSISAIVTAWLLALSLPPAGALVADRHRHAVRHRGRQASVWRAGAEHLQPGHGGLCGADRVVPGADDALGGAPRTDLRPPHAGSEQRRAFSAATRPRQCSTPSPWPRRWTRCAPACCDS